MSNAANDDRLMSTSEFARLAGCAAQTLRDWDKKGKLTPHARTTLGDRLYTTTQLERARALMAGADRRPRGSLLADVG